MILNFISLFNYICQTNIILMKYYIKNIQMLFFIACKIYMSNITKLYYIKQLIKKYLFKITTSISNERYSIMIQIWYTQFRFQII